MSAQEELQTRDDVAPILEKLKADSKYVGKKFRVVDSAIGVVVFINPSPAQYKIMRAGLWSDDDNVKSSAMPNLLRLCIVHPGKEALDSILEDRPGAVDALVKDFNIHLGLAKDADAK